MWNSVFEVSWCFRRLYPSFCLQACVYHHGSRHFDDRSVRPLAYPILLRGVRDGLQLDDAQLLANLVEMPSREPCSGIRKYLVRLPAGLDELPQSEVRVAFLGDAEYRRFVRCFVYEYDQVLRGNSQLLNSFWQLSTPTPGSRLCER